MTTKILERVNNILQKSYTTEDIAYIHEGENKITLIDNIENIDSIIEELYKSKIEFNSEGVISYIQFIIEGLGTFIRIELVDDVEFAKDATSRDTADLINIISSVSLKPWRKVWFDPLYGLVSYLKNDNKVIANDWDTIGDILNVPDLTNIDSMLDGICLNWHDRNKDLFLSKINDNPSNIQSYLKGYDYSFSDVEKAIFK